MYKYHTSNLKYLEKAIKLVQLDLRYYISKNEKDNIEIYTKIMSLLITNWTEVRLLKLLYEKNAFTDVEIKNLLTISSLNDKWLRALDYAICNAYNISFSKNYEKIKKQLNSTPRFRYSSLRDIISNDLNKSIQVRNRIAHGQWVYALTNDLNSISNCLTGELRNENIVKLQLTMKLFQSLANLIHDLAVSPPTFEKDFDNHFKKIEQQKNNLHNRNYEDYKLKMQNKYMRGQKKKHVNISL